MDNNVDSLDNTISEESENTIIDFIPNHNSPAPDTNLEQESLKIEIQRILQILPIRERQIIKYYYGLDGTHALSIEEIAKRMDLSTERVRQIRDKALRKLKNNKEIKLLNQYINLRNKFKIF